MLNVRGRDKAVLNLSTIFISRVFSLQRYRFSERLIEGLIEILDLSVLSLAAHAELLPVNCYTAYCFSRGRPRCPGPAYIKKQDS